MGIVGIFATLGILLTCIFVAYVDTHILWMFYFILADIGTASCYMGFLKNPLFDL